jgi:para-nitrobenzyl esterase
LRWRAPALQDNLAIHDDSQIATCLWGKQWTEQTGKTVYTCFWTHATPGPDHDMRGAYHGSEINDVFNSLAGTNLRWTGEDGKIADMMSSCWVNYDKTGDLKGSGLPNWPAFDAKSRTVTLLGDSFRPVTIADDAKFDFWKRFFATNNGW